MHSLADTNLTGLSAALHYVGVQLASTLYTAREINLPSLGSESACASDVPT